MTYSRRGTPAIAADIQGKAIPLLGIGILMAGTAYELYEACGSMRDLEELYARLGMEGEMPGDGVSEVYRLVLPQTG